MLSSCKILCTIFQFLMIKCVSLSIQTVPFKRRLSFLNTLSITRPTQKAAADSASSRLTHQFISSGLKISAKSNLFRQGEQLHGQIIKLGYQYMLPLQNLLLNFYLKCKYVTNARQLFDEMIVRNVVTWNTMICGLADKLSDFESNFDLGFGYFGRMLMGNARPDWITFRGLFRLSVDMGDIETSKVLHCFVMKLGFCDHLFLSSALVDMYGKLRLVEEARRAFELLVHKDLVLWNSMVSCYALNRLPREALRLYNLMRLEGFMGDEFTFTNLLNSCAGFGFCQIGRGIHGIVVKLNFDLDVLVASSLVDMYAKNENLHDAHKAFDMMIFKNVVSWNSMIVGYGQNGNGIQAMKLLNKMIQEDFHPDELTMASVLISCADTAMVGEIIQVHAYTLKNGFSSFTSVANAMISAYSKCGSIICALQTFRSILEPDLVSWTSIIGAYGSHGFPNEAIKLFEKMLSNGVKPDRISFLEILSSCGHSGLINEGLRYFTLMIDVYKIVPDPEHYACLVDLLGKAGLLKEAFDFLTSMPVEPGSDAMGAFLGACKVHGNLGLAKWAVEKLFALEPKNSVNYILMSNMYASNGAWLDVANIRRLMREKCYTKAPGCSWMEIAGKVYSFVSGDNSHPQAIKVYSLLELLYELMKVDDHELVENFR